MRAAIILMLVLSGCAATPPREHRPLLEQILRMRVGYKELTNRICREESWKGECVKESVLLYDLNDAAVRKRLVENFFVCRIHGRRYKIDPDAPRFVRYRRAREWFLGREKTEKTDPIPFSDTQKLLDGRAECWSEKTYPSGIH